MSDYAATALSLTPVNGSWRDVLSRIFQYLGTHHEPWPAPPERGSLLTVDSGNRKILSSPDFDLNGRITQSSGATGVERWISVTTELLFGRHPSFVNIQIQLLDAEQASVELWLPSRVYETVFDFDPDCRQFSSDAKADLIRLFLGVSKALSSSAFGYRLAGGNEVFGPLTVDSAREYVEVGNRWLGNTLELIIAGVSSSLVEGGRFEYDLDDPPMHYRQNGYYLYDILWPRT